MHGLNLARAHKVKTRFGGFLLAGSYLQTQLGSAACVLLPHCATSGARHDISQRVPSTTALHMLPVRPTIEFVIAPVFSASTELVTLEELRDVIELLTSVELLESMELVDSVDWMFCAEAHVHSPRANTVTRYLISQPSNVSPCWLVKH